MVKKLPYEVFKSIYSQVPRLCVDLVIRDNEGVLLTFRNIDPKGFWHLPGGTVLLDESVEEAAQRIAQEELGVEISLKKLLGVMDFHQGYTGLGHPVSLAYDVIITRGEIKLDEQASEAKFFKKIPSNTLGEHKKFLLSLIK